MDRIKVVSGVLTVPPGGRVRLSLEQSQPRAHKLEGVKGRKGEYVVRVPIQFKTGEELAIDAVAKAQLPQIEFLDPAPASQPVG